MTLEYIQAPPGTDEDVLRTVVRLYLREVYVKGADNSLTGPVSNMDDCNGGYFVRDSAEYVATVKAAVGKALAAVPKQETLAPRMASYTPRHVNVSRLASMLDPFRRVIRVPGAPGRGPDDRTNVSFQSKPPVILLQDTPEQVEQMLALLEQMDKAPPQFLVQCLVLATSMNPGDEGGLPPELTDNLRRLLPWRGYAPLATALVRASIEPGGETQLSGRLVSGEAFQIHLQPGGVDLAARQLSLERVRFDSGTQSFETSAVIGLDEYTVLGAAGSDPCLVVLRVTNLSR